MITRMIHPLVLLLLVLMAVLEDTAGAAREVMAQPITKTSATSRRRSSPRTSVWDEENNDDVLLRFAFGDIVSFHGSHCIFKKIRIRNNSNDDVMYKVTSKYANAPPLHDNELSSLRNVIMVSPVFPGKIKIDSGMERTISVVMTIRHVELFFDDFKSLDSQQQVNVSKLLLWNDDGIEGSLVIDDGVEPAYLAWKLDLEGRGELGSADEISAIVSTQAK